MEFISIHADSVFKLLKRFEQLVDEGYYSISPNIHKRGDTLSITMARPLK